MSVPLMRQYIDLLNESFDSTKYDKNSIKYDKNGNLDHYYRMLVQLYRSVAGSYNYFIKQGVDDMDSEQLIKLFSPDIPYRNSLKERFDLTVSVTVDRFLNDVMPYTKSSYGTENRTFTENHTFRELQNLVTFFKQLEVFRGKYTFPPKEIFHIVQTKFLSNLKSIVETTEKLINQEDSA